MISHHAAKLLRILKKALIKTGDILYINLDDGIVEALTDENDPNRKAITLKSLVDEVPVLLKELQCEEKIIYKRLNEVEYDVEIQAKGLFSAELTLRKVVREFVRSFLFPALVALATTLITKALSA